MGGFFGITSKEDCLHEVFFGVDYHSHLGTKTGGMASYDKENGMMRQLHKISNSPFRTKFDHVLDDMQGTAAIGCINDGDPQPLLVRSGLGLFAICFVGVINNAQELIEKHIFEIGGHYEAMTGGKINTTELLAALINRKQSFAEGIRYAQELIEGTASILILKEGGSIIAARDLYGRIPVQIGKNPKGYAVSFESFAYQKFGYEDEMELGPGEVVEVTPEGIRQLMAPGKKKKVCAFLWSYYGYPTSTYEGVNVEVMRYRNGAIMARHDAEAKNAEEVDYVGGVPDSGTPHAIGYSNESGKQFARAFIKYTPTWARSFMPTNQKARNEVAKMKQIPVRELIRDKNLLFVDDSIVRGTQLQETVNFLYDNGAKSVHMRSACPPLMYACKYLSFTRTQSDLELITRRVILELEGEEGLNHLEEYSDGSTERGKKLRNTICEKFNFASLEFQSLEGIVEAIGMDPCELCTYCWSGKE